MSFLIQLILFCQRVQLTILLRSYSTGMVTYINLCVAGEIF